MPKQTARRTKRPAPAADGADAGAKRATTPLLVACERLRLSAAPSRLPCRDAERDRIERFLVGALEADGDSPVLYVAGMPGTGKTATVYEVLRALEAQSAQGDLPAFAFLEVNGMKLPEPAVAYSMLWEKLSGETCTPAHAKVKAEELFAAGRSARDPCLVVLLDELDLLLNRKQDVIYNFFDWPNKARSRLVVLGIANTMDIPERFLSRIHSRLGMQKISFRPYQREQIEAILRDRVADLGCFEGQALEFCSRKIAAVTGDVRRALDACRGAAKLANATGAPRVTLSHIDTVIKEGLQSSRLRIVQHLSLFEQLFLTCVLDVLRRSGVEETTFSVVFSRCDDVCRSLALERASTSDMAAVCARLGGCRLLLIEAGRTDFDMKIRVDTDPDDMIHALCVAGDKFERILGA